MTVQSGGNKNTQSNPQAQAPINPSFAEVLQPQVGHQTTASVQSTFSLGSLGSMMRSPMSRTPEGAALSSTMGAFNEILKGINIDDSDYVISLLPIDMEKTMAVRISAIVFAVELKNKPTGTAFHTVLLEGSVEQPLPIIQNINGRNVELLRTTADYNDEKLVEEAVSVLRSKYQAELYNANASVLARDFDLKNTAAVKNFMANAVTACVTEISVRTKDFQDVNLGLVTSDVNLSLRRQFNMNEQAQDINGHPVRSDIIITMQAAPKDPTQASRVSDIARATGFVDLVYIFSGDNGVGNFFQQPNQQPVANKYYRPRFVATSLECTKVNTIAAQLLALLPVLTLRGDGNDVPWARTFTNESNNPMRDIGAIGWEIPTRNADNTMSCKFVDTHEAGFKTNHLYRFIGDAIENNLLISIDVPECGGSTWMNDTFPASAAGKGQATQAIIDGAMTLTNGHFGKYFNDSVVGIHEENRIHAGYYINDKGIRCDIRNLDYLAVANYMGKIDPNIIREWSDTFFPGSGDLAIRLATRARIMKGIFGDNIVFTGFYTRVTLGVPFTNALISGVADVKFNWTIQDQGQDVTNIERRRGGFDDRFNMAGNGTGTLSRQMSFGNQGNNMVFNGGTRW